MTRAPPPDQKAAPAGLEATPPAGGAAPNRPRGLHVAGAWAAAALLPAAAMRLLGRRRR